MKLIAMNSLCDISSSEN